MTKSLLTMCTEIMEDIGSLVIPGYLFTNSDDTAKQLIAISKKVGRELVRMKWQELEKIATVTTVADTASYSLEDDYHCLISDTAWDATTYKMAIGQQTPMNWQTIINLPITVSTEHFYRIRGNLLYITPTPDSVWSFTYEYRSKYFCESSSGTDQGDWVADSDLPLLPEDAFMAGIKYYFCKAKGLPFSDAEAEYNEILDHYGAVNKPAGIINMAASVIAPNQGYTPYFNIPDRVDD